MVVALLGGKPVDDRTITLRGVWTINVFFSIAVLKYLLVTNGDDIATMNTFFLFSEKGRILEGVVVVEVLLFVCDYYLFHLWGLRYKGATGPPV